MRRGRWDLGVNVRRCLREEHGVFFVVVVVVWSMGGPD